ncbi:MULTISPECIES: hypothetical protein [Synechococcales]|uniref:hypothetical protein n=1 Tax=Synechococcus sp. CS-1333 TaxID=2848638 RepID=UPI00223B8863|nr:hypothetical protein [Synechococcus sp. CS-1333]
MAKGDAELFRTVGEQNAAIRQLVEEVAPAGSNGSNEAAALQGSPQSLLPQEQCTQAALKARFGSAAAAHAHLETVLGPAPTKKKTWEHLSTVFESGAWPAPARALARPEAGRGGVSEEALAQLETRLLRRIDQLEDRVIAVLEKVLLGKS